MIRRIIAALGVAGAEVVANVIEIASVIAIDMIPIMLLMLLHMSRINLLVARAHCTSKCKVNTSVSFYSQSVVCTRLQKVG